MKKTQAIIDSHVAIGQKHHLLLIAPELLSNMDQAGISMSIVRPLSTEVAIYNRAAVCNWMIIPDRLDSILYASLPDDTLDKILYTNTAKFLHLES